MVNDAEPLMRQHLRDCWVACQDADVIVVSILPYLLGYAIAQKLQVPLVRTFNHPVSPTRSHPPGFVPSWLRLGGSFNLAAYQAQRIGIERLPVHMPFGELDRQQQLLLYCYSAAVAPPPPDWGPWIDVTGYDQFFWGKRVFELGVGPRLIPRNCLNAQALAAALRTANRDPGMRQRAGELGARIRAEEGVARAVAAFERHFGRPSQAATSLTASAAERLA
jgi:UDP:flavonoid glycosyltransferase YjiC (YdhE family)